jgi:AAA domain
MSDRGEPIHAREQRRFEAVPADLSKVGPIEFVWAPWLIRGRMNMMAGEERSGKSTLSAWIAAKLTKGELPGIFEGKPMPILFVGADEDDWHKVTLPRLMAAGADMDLIEEFRPTDPKHLFDVEKDIEELRRILGANEYALVVLEHLMDILPRISNPNAPALLRREVRPLRGVLNDRNTAALGPLHVNKAQAQTFRQHAQGSMQWTAMSRSAFLVDRHPQDRSRRVVVLGPANYVKDDEPLSLEFAIADHIFSHNGQLINLGMAVDVEESDISMEDVLAREGRESARDIKRRERREAVLDAVTDEPQSARAIAIAAGVPRETTRNILIDLEIEGLVREGVDGWVTQSPRP